MTGRAMLSTAVGGALLLAVGVNAGVDLSRVSRDWSRYGPLGGGEVPHFAAVMMDGGSFEPADLEGRVSVVTFWATWCGVCMSELSMYESLHEELAADENTQVVLVNREGNGVPAGHARKLVAQTAAERGLKMPLALDDGSMYRAFRASFLPHTVVVDRDGDIRHVHPGRVLQSTLRSEVAAILEEG